ncbi:MAG TPA: FG-GAP-like repeat-containing protein [Pyrinomonadaceae bacterium]|nr:FG-GAP-like repeat-containing protein [Pyrinomonadaceae bacterium]
MKYLRITIAALTLIFCLAIVEKNYAATLTVTNTNDSGAGSLRQAVLDSNVNNQNDTIVFDMTVFSTPQTITLTSGQIVILPDRAVGISKTLTISGPGANLLTINGNNNGRIFGIDTYTVIDGVKITGGNGQDSGTNPNINSLGGAIAMYGGTFDQPELQNLVLKNSIVSGNQTVINSGSGGALYLAGKVTIMNSTISNNTSSIYGGAIYNISKLTVINSTISDNTAALTGGIYSDRDIYLYNSTVAFNTGGSIRMVSFQTSYPVLYAQNSIISNSNIGGNPTGDIGGDYWSYGNNIIGNTAGIVTRNSSPTDQLNVDPQLDPQLSNNGGITPTHAILSAASPAVDRGNNCVLISMANGGCLESPLTTDQRGVARPQDGDGNGSAIVDVGSFELTGPTGSPAPGVADLQAASDTGISSTDNITNSRNLTFDIGSVTSGATVEFYRNGTLINSVVASGTAVTFNDSNLPAGGGVFSYNSRQVINGVPSLFSEYLTVMIDTTAPTVTVNQATIQFDPTTAQPLNYVAVFNEAVTGFDAADVSLADSTAGVSSAVINISGSSPTYNISVSGIFPDGIVRASVPANAVQDVAGNANVASTSTDNSITLDYTAPTVTINQAAAQADPTRNMPVNFTVIFSEPVTGFNNADISLTGSTANIGSASITVTGSGAVYNVAVSGLTSNGGFVTAAVRSQAASDGAGNQSVASTSTDNVVTLDNTSPTVTLNQAVGQVDPTSVLPINFTVVFSEPVTGFDSTDISFTGSSVSTTQATVTITGSGTTYNVAIGGTIVSNGGSLQVRIISGAAQDALGNLSFASTSTDNIVRIDNVSPTVTINQAIGQSDPASTQPVNFTVVFSEIVTGLTASDISLSGSTANVSSAVINVTGSGNVYTVSVSGITSSGQVRASVIAGAAADALGNPSLASTSSDNTVTVSIPNRSQLFDFDGDRKTDISIFRPSSGEWWYSKSSNNQTAVLQFGLSTDKLVPTDFTGDGKTDIAVWRGSTGEWFILRSEDNSFYSIPFGAAGDIPAVGDFDGDGRGDLTVFRPSTSTWYIQRSSGGFAIQQFGIEGDVPVVGDYDGDGRSDLAIFRPAVGEWWYTRSSDGQIAAAQFGSSTDKPVQGDYTGDGKTDIAFWRPSTGEWFVLRSENGNYFSVPFGTSGDTPAAGDYDGDGKFDFAVFRSSQSTWYIQATTAGTLITTFGSAGDVAVPAAFVP